MKYVKPISLIKVMRKTAMEMAERKAIGEFSSLLGLNIMEDYVSIGITYPESRIRSAIHYGVVERNHNINTIAHEFRSISFVENVSGFVISLPHPLKSENPEVAKVKSFVDQLSNTGKLESLKYTYWERRFETNHMEIYSQSWQFGGEDDRQFMLERHSGVSILQGYLDHYCKYENENGNGNGSGVEVEDEMACFGET